MKGRLLFAESASAHNDGTVSILRAGINRVTASAPPVLLRGAIVATIHALASERGTHSFEINCINEDGVNRLPPINGTFETPPTGGTNNIIVSISHPAKDFGTYQFNLVIDRLEHDSVSVNLIKAGETHGTNDTK